MAKSEIEWTDYTWNPVTGCSKVSPGCKNCYAERIMTDRFGRSFEVTLYPERLEQPLHWIKPRRIFVNSMSDTLHEQVSVTYLEKILGVISRCPQHTFLMLTKRADRLKILTSDRTRECINTQWPMKNLLVGVSVENQEQADLRIPELLRAQAALRFVSVEPLLEPVELHPFLAATGARIDWVIVGCESGPNRRPCEIEWIREIVYQCKYWRVPCFVKQISMDGAGINGAVVKDISQFPELLRVREWPEVR